MADAERIREWMADVQAEQRRGHRLHCFLEVRGETEEQGKTCRQFPLKPCRLSRKKPVDSDVRVVGRT